MLLERRGLLHLQQEFDFTKWQLKGGRNLCRTFSHASKSQHLMSPREVHGHSCRHCGARHVGKFAQFGLAALNDSGQVVFRSRLFQGNKSAQGLYRVGPAEEVTALAQQFQPAPPDGSKLYRSIEDNRYRGPSESGLAFFVAGLMNADRSYSIQDTGIFLAD